MGGVWAKVELAGPGEGDFVGEGKVECRELFLSCDESLVGGFLLGVVYSLLVGQSKSLLTRSFSASEPTTFLGEAKGVGEEVGDMSELTWLGVQLPSLDFCRQSIETDGDSVRFGFLVLVGSRPVE